MESRRGLNTNPSRYPPHSLQAILADLETNTRAGYTLRKPARKSRRAVRIEKSALTVLRHFSTAEGQKLQMLHIWSHILKRSSAQESALRPSEAILVAMRMLLLSQLQHPREGYDLRRA